MISLYSYSCIAILLTRDVCDIDMSYRFDRKTLMDLVLYSSPILVNGSLLQNVETQKYHI